MLRATESIRGFLAALQQRLQDVQFDAAAEAELVQCKGAAALACAPEAERAISAFVDKKLIANLFEVHTRIKRDNARHLQELTQNVVEHVRAEQIRLASLAPAQVFDATLYARVRAHIKGLTSACRANKELLRHGSAVALGLGLGEPPLPELVEAAGEPREPASAPRCPQLPTEAAQPEPGYVHLLWREKAANKPSNVVLKHSGNEAEEQMLFNLCVRREAKERPRKPHMLVTVRPAAASSPTSASELTAEKL